MIEILNEYLARYANIQPCIPVHSFMEKNHVKVVQLKADMVSTYSTYLGT